MENNRDKKGAKSQLEKVYVNKRKQGLEKVDFQNLAEENKGEPQRTVIEKDGPSSGKEVNNKINNFD